MLAHHGAVAETVSCPALIPALLVITALLIGLSYASNDVRIGCVVLMLHEITDVFGCCVKIAVRSDSQFEFTPFLPYAGVLF